jgi:hypothetical protein
MPCSQVSPDRVLLESLGPSAQPPGSLSTGMQIQSMSLADGTLLVHDGEQAQLYSLDADKLEGTRAGGFQCQAAALALLKSDALVGGRLAAGAACAGGDLESSSLACEGAWGSQAGRAGVTRVRAACALPQVRTAGASLELCNASGGWRLHRSAVQFQPFPRWKGAILIRPRCCIPQATCGTWCSWTQHRVLLCCWTRLGTCWPPPLTAATCAPTSWPGGSSSS